MGLFVLHYAVGVMHPTKWAQAAESRHIYNAEQIRVLPVRKDRQRERLLIGNTYRDSAGAA